MIDIAQLERDVLGIARRVREEFTAELSTLRLEADHPELARDSDLENSHASEVAMYVRRDGDIVDVIEFQVHRGGVANASPDDVESWLRTTFKDVIQRQRERNEGHGPAS